MNLITFQSIEALEFLNNNDNVKYPIWCWVKCYDGIWPPTVKGKKVE